MTTNPWKPPTCPYCGGQSVLRDTAILYGGRSYGLAWVCENYPVCDAYVGAHKRDNRPKGRLADPELRDWKQRAHEAFDHLWQNGRRSRQDAYKLLAEALKVPSDHAHIGMFDVAACKRVVEVFADAD